jgi:hypothetical protein
MRVVSVPTQAEIAQSLDEMASAPVVECVECGAAMVQTNRAKLYCSLVCHQTLKTVHYARATVADGRFERDPTIEDALRVRVAYIIAGGYHEVERRVPPALRAQIFARDDHKCVLCGEPATQIDHIAGDANTPENLRASCGACNLGLAQAQLVPAPPEKAAVAERIFQRMFAPAPLVERDDESAWDETQKHLMADRRRQVRDHLAMVKLIARSPEIERWLSQTDGSSAR